MKLMKKQRDAGPSVISMEMIKSERICMPMKLVSSRKVKYINSAYKEKITSAINHYQLVGEIKQIEDALWKHNKKCKNYALTGLSDIMCSLMNKCEIIHGKLFFGVNYQTFRIL